MLLIPKKSGDDRLCIDYRALNAITITDNYPAPDAHEHLANFSGCDFFTALDLNAGFHQIPMKETDIPKTSFVVASGQYEYVVMPFGLKGAPATCQRLLDALLTGIPNTAGYMDDSTIGSKGGPANHIKQLQTVLQRAREFNITFNIKKLQLGKQQLNILGVLLSVEGCQPDPQKVTAIQQYQPPRDVKGVREFLGMASYHRQFIRHFSHIAKPLTNLLVSDALWQWSDAQQTAFDTLKQHLATAPVLAHPDFSSPFILTTDASDIGMGAVLSQVQGPADNRKEHVIAYASRLLKAPETRYPAHEKEGAAIISSHRNHLAEHPISTQKDALHVGA